uniref:Uncharacterized protein n=1 Tax=Panagrolaimus sp. ES5 TaxID=591445 RepID=A0AC34F0W0_9BILA
MAASIQLLPVNITNETFVAFFQSINPKEIDVIVADFLTNKFVSTKSFTCDNFKKFADEIPKLFDNKFKAVILNVFAFTADGYENDMAFYQDLREKFASLHIPTYFVALSEYMSTCFFIATNTTISQHETVIYILDNTETIAFFECTYTKNGYDKDLVENIECDVNTDANILRKRIIRSSNPKKIIFATGSIESQKTNYFKNEVFNDFIVDVLDLKKLRLQDIAFVVEMSKWLLDKNYIKFCFLPKSARKFVLVFLSFEKEIPTPHEILSIKSHGNLPVEKSACIERSPSNRKIHLVSIDSFNNKSTRVQELIMIKQCHSNEIILKVDSESFPIVEVRPSHIFKLLAMPKVFEASIDPQNEIPFVGIYGNSSVICYCNVADKKEYQFLETWNGIYGNGLCISFNKKKPIFGDAIHETHDFMPSSIIFDLIKIMSMPSDDIKTGEYWRFKIIKDEKNPVLLEFDTFDGTQKAASPAFLMAMLLRQHLKAIEAKTGKKPNELGFCFFDKFEEAEEKRIENQIKESCALLKIDCNYCIFT